MHQAILEETIRICRQRIAEGDFPSIPAVSVETLEEAVDDLAALHERAQFVAFDRVLNCINTIDATGSEFRSKLYAAVMEMRPQMSTPYISHCSGCGEAWNQRAEGLECPRCSRPAPDIRASAESFVEKHRDMLKRLADE